MVTANDKPDDDKDTEPASEDVGNVANGVLKASAWDAAQWIDSYRSGCCVCRAADEKSRCIVLKLFCV